MAHWHVLNQEAQLEAIGEASFSRPQLIFKHSTRCGISAEVLERLDLAGSRLTEAMDVHYLDLLAFRPVSNQVAAQWSVPHQSPQAILLVEGRVAYQASHFSIMPEEILRRAAAPRT